MRPQARCDVYVTNGRLYINGTEVENVLAMMVDRRLNHPDVVMLRLQPTMLAYGPGSNDPTQRDPVQPVSDPPARVADVDVNKAIRSARARQDGPKRLRALVRTAPVSPAPLMAAYTDKTDTERSRLYDKAVKHLRQGN